MSNVIKKLFLSLLKHILKDGQPWSQPLRLQTKSECLGKVKNITCYSDGFLCTSELSKNFWVFFWKLNFPVKMFYCREQMLNGDNRRRGKSAAD